MTDPRGGRHLVCEMVQLIGDERTACATDASALDPNVSGWCFVKYPPESPLRCPNFQNGVRTLGGAAKRAGAVMTLLCRAYLA